MTWLLLAIVAVAGVPIGMWSAVRFELSMTLSRFVVAATMLMALGAPLVEALRPVAALSVGLALGLVATCVWWKRTDLPRRRAQQHFDAEARREILWHELIGALPRLSGILVPAAVGLSAANGRWVGAGLAVVVLAAGLWVARPREVPVTSSNPPTVAGDLVVTESPGDRARVVDLMTRSRSHTAAVTHPPVLFRGLVGWNLGLGLDAEAAAWAAQIARGVGLGDHLSEPEWMLDAHQSHLLTLSRALGGPHRTIVVELEGEVATATMRAMARLVSQHRAGRSVLVVTDDPGVGRTFLSRSR